MRRVALIAVALAIAACGGGSGGSDTARSTSSAAKASQPSPPAGPAPRLTVSHPCDNAKGFTCSTLLVPLDHSGHTPGDLRLAVAAGDNADAPKGVLVALTGGPGQGGVDFVPRSRVRMRALLHDYRLVMFDQRGTGAAALRCPALQRAVGTSDLTVPPPGSVEACARTLGPNRRFYSTADTVADLEALRVALGADKLTLDGVSYGTFVAERYAIAHPDRVAKLVLDSVVPAAGLDGLEVDGMHETARVLRAVCRAQHCPGDPAADLAAVVRARHNGASGPAIDDTLVALSVGAPSFPGVIAALREARAGHPQHLERLVRVVRRAQRAPAQVLSQGLHAATLCADTRSPWGGAGRSAGRPQARPQVAAAARPTRRHTTARPSSATATRSNACAGRPRRRRRRRARATCHRCRRCCWPATATCRRRCPGHASRRRTRPRAGS